MTERELIEAIFEMLPDATNVIGFHALTEAEDHPPPPIRRIEYECHIAAGGHALALHVHRLTERLKTEGITP